MAVGNAARSPRRGRIARGLAALFVILSWLYPCLLLALLLALRSLGERCWVTCLGLYMPRALLLLPLPVFALGLVLLRAYTALLAQLAALLIALFPLMGLKIRGRHAAGSQGRTLRVLSYNVDSAHAGYDAVAEDAFSFDPDLVLIQEISTATGLAERLHTRFPDVHNSGQFVVASRYPLVESPPMGVDECASPVCGAHFQRYVIATPLGRIAVYNIHPVSPREGFRAMRGQGLSHELLSGRFFEAEHASVLLHNALARDRQLRVSVDRANAERIPVIIGGDTNLPDLSPTLAHYFASYRDGFRDAGRGFGYTFPAHRSWMRLDRIFASQQLEFLSFTVGCASSDHRCVVADLQLTPP